MVASYIMNDMNSVQLIYFPRKTFGKIDIVAIVLLEHRTEEGKVC